MDPQSILDKLNQEEKTELMELAMSFRDRDTKSSSEYSRGVVSPSQYMHMYSNLALAVLQFSYSMEMVSPHPLFEGRNANDWLEIITRRRFAHLGKRPLETKLTEAERESLKKKLKDTARELKIIGDMPKI